MLKYIPGMEGELSGNLAVEPEMKFLADGKAITELSICLNGKPIKDSKGEEVKDEKGYPKRPEQWIRLSLFEDLAEEANKILKKGSFIVSNGYLRINGWINDDGEKINRLEWVTRSISYLDKGELVKIKIPEKVEA